MTPDQKERLTNLRRAASRAKKQAERVAMRYAKVSENSFLSANLDAWQKQVEELRELERELK